MHAYLIKIKVDIPYPYEFTFRETASNPAAAISRAMRNLRKQDKIKGKRIKNGTIRWDVIS